MRSASVESGNALAHSVHGNAGGGCPAGENVGVLRKLVGYGVPALGEAAVEINYLFDLLVGKRQPVVQVFIEFGISPVLQTGVVGAC